MRSRLALSIFIASAVLSLQAQSTTRAARPGALPRTPDGHPDLQGVYDLATLTPLESAANQPLVLTDDEAARLEKQVADRKFRAGLPSRGDRDAPPKGGDGSTGAAGNVGGYNNFWIDNGTRYVEVLRHVEPAGEDPSELALLRAEVRHAVREEMAFTLADVVLRRSDLGAAGHPGADVLAAAARFAAEDLGWSRERTAEEIVAVERRYRIPD